MKKLLFLFFTLPIYSYSTSFDKLEEAILAVNAEEVERLLEGMRPLTDLQKMAYAHLAQYVLDTLNIEKYLRYTEGGGSAEGEGSVEDILHILGLIGGIISVPMIVAHFVGYGYNYERDSIKPIVLSAAALGILFICLKKCAHSVQKIQDAKKKKLRDALYIQQKIYLL